MIPDEDEYDYAYEAHDPNRAEKTHTLTTLDDGSKYQDYTYQVIAEYGGSNGDEYLEEGKPQLIVEYDGDVKQVLTVPQDDGVVDHIDSDDEPYYYFFGCFRPQLGIVETPEGLASMNTLLTTRTAAKSTIVMIFAKLFLIGLVPQGIIIKN